MGEKMTQEEFEKLAAEWLTALAPVLMAVQNGDMDKDIAKKALNAAADIASHHVFAVDGFAVLATLKALGRVPQAIVDFLLAHPYAEVDPLEEYHRAV